MFLVLACLLANEQLCYVATIKDVTIRQRIKKIVRTVVIGGLILFVGKSVFWRLIDDDSFTTQV